MNEPAPWTDRDSFIWYIRGGELDGMYFRSHFPNLIDEYEGEVVLWYWDDNEGDKL